jgi:hypothetical protein
MAQAASEAEQAAAAPAAVTNATPLGMFAFGTSVIILSCVNAGIIVPKSGAGLGIEAGMALFYGGVVLLVVGIFEFRAGNNFTGTVFSSFAAFWLAFGFLLLPGSGLIAEMAKEGSFLPAVGLLLLVWTIIAAMFTICVLRTTTTLLVTFVALTLTLLSLTIFYLGGAAFFNTLGGYLGIITSLLAWYIGLAGILPYINPSIKLPA